VVPTLDGEKLTDDEKRYVMLGLWLCGFGIGTRFVNAKGEPLDPSAIDFSDFSVVAAQLLNVALDPEWRVNRHAPIPPLWLSRLLLAKV
jgi:hypothetical protein